MVKGGKWKIGEEGLRPIKRRQILAGLAATSLVATGAAPVGAASSENSTVQPASKLAFHFDDNLNHSESIENTDNWNEGAGSCCDGSESQLGTWNEDPDLRPKNSHDPPPNDYTPDYHANIGGNFAIQHSGGYGNFWATYTFSTHSDRYPEAPYTPSTLSIRVGASDTEEGFNDYGEIKLKDADGNEFVHFYFPIADKDGGFEINDHVVESNRNNGLYKVHFQSIDWTNSTFDVDIYKQTETGYESNPVFSETGLGFSSDTAADFDKIYTHGKSSTKVYLDALSIDGAINDGPTAAFTVSTENIQTNEEVTFDASDSTGDITEYRWDFTDDGSTDATGEVVDWTFEESGNHSVMLTVVTGDGETATSTEVIPVAVQTGDLEATVVGDTGPLPDGVNAYAIDAVRKHEALDYIGGSRSSLPSYLADGTLDDNHKVSFGAVEVGEYVVLVDASAADDDLDSFLEDDISVVGGETTTAEIPFAPDRPLQPLADIVEQTNLTAIGRSSESLTPLAKVYIDGYNLFESPDLDGADYLDKALSLTNFALSGASADSAAELAFQTKVEAANQLSMPIAEAGYHEVLATQWEEVNGTQYQSELAGYTEDLQAADGILAFEPTGSVAEAETAFQQTTIYNDTIAALDDTLETFNTDTVLRDPPDGFAMSEVKRVLESQRRWLDDGGLAPGVVFTPRDETYLVGELEYHAAAFQNVESNFETAEDLNLVAQGVSAAGKGIALAGGWTVAGLAVGTVAKVAGSVGSLALEMYQTHAKNRLADTWVKSLMYWVSDLDDTRLAYSGLVTWMESELDDPTPLAAIDGTLTASLNGVSPPETDETFLTANRPTYPAWWTLPAPQLKHVGTVEVTVENTGSEPSEARVMLSIRAGDSDAGSVTPSDAVSMHPAPEDPPMYLAPGETRTVEVEYRADFELADALSWQVMSTTLWMDGKFVDETNTSFYVVPSTGAVPGQSTEPSSEGAGGSTDTTAIGFSTTDDGNGSARTQASSSAYGETVEVIQGATLTPDNPTVTTTYEPGSGLDTIAFVLQGVPEADIHLHIYDEQDRHIGFDAGTDTDVVEIPDGTYNGSDSNLEVITVPAAAVETLDVAATAKSFTAAQPVELTVEAVEVPTRGAVLSTAGAAVTTVLSPGETKAFDIEIREIGKQTTLEEVAPMSPSLERSDGSGFEPAGGSTTFGPESFDVAPGEATPAELSLSATESLTLPDGPETRFEGTATVESANTEPVEVPVSVLVLDTTVDDARLTGAAPSVRGARLAETPVSSLSESVVPEAVEPLAAYEAGSVLADGADSGEVSLAVPDAWDSSALAVYLVDDGAWTDATWERVSDELVVTLPGGRDATVVIAADRYTLPAYTTADGRVDNDGLRDAVDDWRNGNVDTSVLRDVVDAWRTNEPIG